jgi:cardiolipin synthase A/B
VSVLDPETALGVAHRDPAEDEATRVRRCLEGVLGVPATEGNRIDVLRNGDEIFPAMFEAIDGAEHTLDFLTFVYWEGEIGTELAGKLCARADDDVRVRVLLDGWGARTIDRQLIDDMDEAGVDVQWFRPLRRLRPAELNHRTHRKVLVVDEDVAFTGGVGIADVWTGDARNEDEWRDTHFRVRGPAVDGLRAAFLDNWAENTPELFTDVDRFPAQPSAGDSVVQCVRSESETGWSDIDNLFRTLLQLARRRVRIATAYFVPDDELCRRLCEASERGVEIEILVPGRHVDKRVVQLAGERSYQGLVEAGVSIWRYQPTMMHAKVMTVDGLVSNIGSANLNPRSVAWDEEVNLVALDPALTAVLDQQFDEDLERSDRLDPGRWANRSLARRLGEALVRPLRRWF